MRVPDAGPAVLAAVLSLSVAGACSPAEDAARGAPPAVRAADPDGWRPLFDGETTEGWRGFRLDHVPEGWQAVDGTLARVAPAGDLITTEQFADFELELEWKVGPGGNSGIFFRATEDVELIYFGAPEMQILDDEGHRDGLDRRTAAGANYDLHPAPEGVVRPAGEWNHVRLVVDGAHVEHWMNGERLLAYELWSDDWEERVANSKFVEWPEYGRASTGHIGLQDHGDPVAFRNVRIRELR